MLILTVAGVVGIAGCGGGDSTNDTAAVDPALLKLGADHGWNQTDVTVDAASLDCQGKASNPTRGVTDTSIKIGGLATVTSPSGIAFGDADAGAKARFARANAEGGIAGRTIDYVGVRDDGSDPARNSAQATALVSRDEVFAAAPVLTTTSSYIDTFCKDVTPFFGWGTESGFCGNAIGFSIVGCQTPTAEQRASVNTGPPAMVNALIPAGSPKSIAMIGIDNDAARQGNITVSQGFQAAGFNVVYEKTPIPVSGLSDPTPIVQAVMTADQGAPPAAVFMVTPVGDAVKLLGALRAAGYDGILLTPFYDPRLAGAKELADTYAVMQWQPGLSTDVPGIKQMMADFKAYAPDLPDSLPAMAGYWAADMLVTALQKVGRDLTVDALLKTLNGDYTNYVAGAVPETRWPLNHVAASPCGTLAHLKDGKWSAPALSCGAIAKIS
ncbi:ABC-type branched-chain amino acid transport system, substrate-binding protein [Parafrankia irregularis]|uniref:ABC-type branched-chain amino acid transport system, substrate-binding protein n=1 Tax=Parafrankia irregularis TaxID=795642 RepID=A0A0S4QSI3_9ACTN|nr:MULTISPECIES: ABC transporter substrate-binding protein [Parafrankia]MBE3205869.1 ABC transporter substrate-binding protein [Parafrankia sp. CH37]CUU58185.1 ABC-type branched-chain amino acid transport system, substrate-binding protein [Parafrankia irregularis]